jgi:hypothetical protein
MAMECRTVPVHLTALALMPKIYPSGTSISQQKKKKRTRKRKNDQADMAQEKKDMPKQRRALRKSPSLNQRRRLDAGSRLGPDRSSCFGLRAEISV